MIIKNMTRINDVKYGDKDIQEIYHDNKLIYQREIEGFKMQITGISFKFTTYTSADYMIDWGDGTRNHIKEGTEHTYSQPNTYVVTVYDYKEGDINVSNNPSLTHILTPLPNMTDDTAQGTTFMANFSRCNFLTSIPEYLFANYPVLTTGIRANFWGCELIREIPANLFSNFKSLKTLFFLMAQTKITEIPNTLFSDLPNLETIGTRNEIQIGVFEGCVELRTIPSDLFVNNPRLYSIVRMFRGCAGLLSVPKDLLTQHESLQYIQYVFLGTNINSLPDLPSTIKDASYAFAQTRIGEIPDDFLSGGVIERTEGMFYGCVDLTSIGRSLLNRNGLLRSTQRMFKSCINLTYIGTGVAWRAPLQDCSEMFADCLSYLGDVPRLWEEHPDAEGTQCFYQCFKASNYDEIPDDWK